MRGRLVRQADISITGSSGRQKPFPHWGRVAIRKLVYLPKFSYKVLVGWVDLEMFLITFFSEF